MLRLQVSGADTPERARIAELIVRSIEAFLRAGVPIIQQVCNERRVAVLDYLSTLPAGRTLAEWGLPNITVEVAVQEATPEFNLVVPPDPLTILLTTNRHPRSPDAAMSCDPVHGVIFVHLPALPGVTVIPLITWHEMLHACGDCEHDGIVRHNKIGVDAVAQLLMGSCPKVGEPPCY